MKRQNFLKSLTGIGLSALGIGGASSFPPIYSGEADTSNGKHPQSRWPDFDRIRNDFPRIGNEIYLDNASMHPFSIHTAAALCRYSDWAKSQLGNTFWSTWSDTRNESKASFAKLINADVSEIAFARSTVEAENNIVNGMDFRGGNVVTTDLHYTTSLYGYKTREKQEGLEVKIIKHKDWKFDATDFEGVIDHNTKLVAITLVSNVNGFFVDDIKAISDLAHSYGAVLYADIIQAAGAVPIDVKAMGIDVAACSTFKWLMGSKGFGFLYVRKDLQGEVIRPSQPNGGVRFNYPPWTDQPDPALQEINFAPGDSADRYEVSLPSYEGVVCALQSLNYIHQLGVPNIAAHARTLTEKLAQEMPRLGYPTITPAGNKSPIIVFQAKDPQQTMRRLKTANIEVAMRFGDKLRISPSVYNNLADIDRLLDVLS